MNDLNSTHFDQYVEIFNSQGKDAANEYITQECNTEYLAFQRRMRSKSNYVYDRHARKYKSRSNEDQFLSLDELCNAKPKTEITTSSSTDKVNFDTIIISLMKDRLSEISKYILFEQSSKEIHIDSKSLKRDGYTITIN